MKTNFWKLATFTLYTVTGLATLLCLLIAFLSLFFLQNPHDAIDFYGNSFDIDNFTFPLHAFGKHITAGIQTLNVLMLSVGLISLVCIALLFFFFKTLIQTLANQEFFTPAAFKKLSIFYGLIVLTDFICRGIMYLLQQRIVAQMTLQHTISYNFDWLMPFASLLIYAIILFLYKKAFDFHEDSRLTI